MELTVLITTIVLMLPGLAGVLLPGLPGVPYMWFVALLYAAAYRFGSITGAELLWLGLIAATTVLVDYLGGALGSKFGGASGRSMGYGILGMIAGTLLLPPFGGLLGSFAGIAISEYQRNRSKDQAIRAASGGVIGSLVSIVINLLLGIGLILMFALFSG